VGKLALGPIEQDRADDAENAGSRRDGVLLLAAHDGVARTSPLAARGAQKPRAHAGRPLPIREIQTLADLASRNATDTLLFRMVEAGEIGRVSKGVYGLMETDAGDEAGEQQDAKMDFARRANG
jgi:hypothetical protein